MGRQGLIDDSGYHGFDECSCYEECTNNIIEHLLEPYGVESIEELVANTYNKALDDFSQGFKDYIYTEKLRGNEPYWTVAIKNVKSKLQKSRN